MKEQQLNPKADPDTAPRRRPRRWRWFVVAVLLLIFLHAPLLRAVGGALMPEAPTGDFDAVVVLGGDHRLQAVIELLESGRVADVWLIEGRPGYVVTAGILPSDVEVLQERLAEMGVSHEHIEVLSDPEVDDLPDATRLLQSRLAGEPQTKLLIVCGALSGRHVRFVLDDVLGPQTASHIAILGLPYDRFDLHQWWRSRSGLKHVFSELCGLGFTLAVGTEPQDPPPAVDPQAIEAELRRRFGEAACYAR